jgi:NagD protein
MDTDISAGIESDMETVLVLSGVTALADLPASPTLPHVLRESSRYPIKTNPAGG